MTTKTVGSPRDLSEEVRLAKNAKIAASQRATRQRRKSQVCKVFTLKVQPNKLNARQREALDRAFVEAKWLYNDALASGDVWNYVPGREVTIKTRDGETEVRELTVLGSQMKQSVVAGIRASLKSLATRKRNGGKVGRLRFRSSVDSLDLKQYGNTYRFHDKGWAKVQNIPGYFRVNGVEQVDGWEPANAKLVRKPDGYYLKVTAYQDKVAYASKTPRPPEGTKVGIDMGIKTHVTLSNGDRVNVSFGETDRLKRLQRKYARQVKGSNERKRTLILIQREYQKIADKRSDAANKLVHRLISENEVVYFQDESVSTWKRRKGWVKAGRSLQGSVLGRVKAKLVSFAEDGSGKAVMLDRWAPTTALCPECGSKNPHDVSLRIYRCTCGYTADRDVHAAKNMILMGTRPDGKYLRAGGNQREGSGRKTR